MHVQAFYSFICEDARQSRWFMVHMIQNGEKVATFDILEASPWPQCDDFQSLPTSGPVRSSAADYKEYYKTYKASLAYAGCCFALQSLRVP
jgi:hypothetical protein